jgi:2-oxo-4-hydroxy-4-carboxy-5-ureidoimidazoline decarboxylase
LRSYRLAVHLAVAKVGWVERITQVNSLPAGELAARLRRCLAVPRWADELIGGRPYPDVEALCRRADELTAGLSDAEVLAALADHPRIGDRPAGSGPTASWSAAEQSGVDDDDVDPLRAANIEYEHQFGHIYLVCATGMSGQDMLADLRRRLTNSPNAELAVVRRELARIARTRLARVVE